MQDPSRLAILETLRGGALTVGAIVDTTHLSRSNVSNHLAGLRDCGLVVAEQDGRFVSYGLSDKRVERFLQTADELLREVARGVYECVHYRAREQSTRERNARERNGVRSVRNVRRSVSPTRRNSK